MIASFITKRYVGLVLCVAALLWAYLDVNDHFGSFSTTVGLMYGVYVTGQSWTDAKTIDKNGGAG